ncbi:ergic-53 [Frankliniella occidentalis]|uniref:Protein ERGIC-53 n=1 Tax=Frankliniella occidentalis TaxID=133901 RepID=A0A6J1S1P0_FRAOC|nr:protein ERGIC-53 [Frankliniella occidentalis]KAE8752669.1 ergic-53 [Frankliniella occidentalis]
MAVQARWLSCSVFLALVISQIIAEVPHKRFEYKYSFKPPYLAQKDGSVPFWEYGGNAIASAENVRIAPSLRSQKGAIWTKAPTNFDWWEVDIVFRVTGRGRIGADGLAFWFTQNKGAYDGQVFGSSDKWVGLGVLFDSFDNDNKHNNPYIMAVLNDGTREFDHQNDGSTQALAGCLRDFRNKPFPTRARIEYYRNTLTVLFHSGMTASDQEYEMCLRAENVHLPKNGYFGVSAATGGLADDHDVLHFLTSSLHAPGQMPVPQAPQVNEEDQRKLTQEYADYQRKLDQQKEVYRKEHPDAPIKDKDEFEEWFESDNQRELRQIFQGQSQMFEVTRELNRKLDEIIGRQERTLSLMSSLQGGGGVPVVTQQQPGQPPVQMIDTIRRHEVDVVLQNQNSILSTARDLVAFVTDVRTRTDTIISNQARQPTAQVQSVGYDMTSLVNEMRDGLNTVKRDVAAASAKLGNMPGGGSAGGSCPTCLTTTMFLVFGVVQLTLLFGYFMYRDSKEAQAKKFF